MVRMGGEKKKDNEKKKKKQRLRESGRKGNMMTSSNAGQKLEKIAKLTSKESNML